MVTDVTGFHLSYTSSVFSPSCTFQDSVLVLAKQLLQPSQEADPYTRFKGQLYNDRQQLSYIPRTLT